MQTLESFKKANSIDTLNFYKSKSSNRLITSHMINGVDTMIMTTETFDKSKPVFVIGAEVGDENGVAKSIVVLTNNAGKTPDLAL